MSVGSRHGRKRIALRVAAIGAGSLALGLLLLQAPADTPLREYWPWLVFVGGGLLAGVVAAVARRRTGTAGTVNRWSRRSKRNDGVASAWMIFRRASWFAVRRKAAV